ncbi:MAG TPA: LCP family protein [Actinoplanes sp.]|nr:LCP family protein [Actinoplanes sp.]
MIEDELRAAFARHEADTPAAGPVRDKIDSAWVRAKRRRTWRRTVGAAAVVALAVAVAPAVFGAYRGSGPALPVAGSTTAPAGPVDVLLLGSDHRQQWEAGHQRADTVMLLHLTADRKQVYLVSLPRGGMLPTGEKLNETLMRGPAVTRAAVQALTGVDIDATVTVGLPALTGITAAVGGVPICLKQGIVANGGRKALPAGCQEIGPDEVRPLIQGRIRLPNGSYDRDAHNRAFLRSLAAKVTADGTGLDELQALLAAAKNGIEVDGDTTSLLRLAASLSAPETIGIGARSAAGGHEGSRTEAIYPEVGPALYTAIREDRLAEWARANPDYVDG